MARENPKDKIIRLENELKKANEIIQKLYSELEECKNEPKIQQIKNERGAGRKQEITDQEREDIRRHRVEGKTIKEIATLFNRSVGIIHKIINEK
ncbi:MULTISPECIES: helix-turn-helix domain-containing protein [unclassified Clostridium]|uniref:helix-turn-helix domain-containing protein n=1 Tax=unclassified Clostridium TaxID=2614128 RepID=UPI0005FB1D8E|nr:MULTISPECIES: helix-turn-helix domain-containing protein [unclassified Clostridium]KJZ84389.1 hypothetical protein ClosIBUN125C_CONTIG62g03385 [Clostridium sp. IBUN125C]KJZ94827.1 hypothetical protein ClosIBUN62F_CONTIG24g00931 [Clostridium sp. IBUN62F]KJZ96810.1 hypothetical protein ClosIBUN22A_CONTIG102g02134 [Clostridium sp. IBUN22A]KJZ97104.1 hypothetical protein ClosIBUN13A_CONTIG140g02083 [Clostridium sp. IBUN13A]